MHSLNLNTNKVYIGQTESTILPLINKITSILFNTNNYRIRLISNVDSHNAIFFLSFFFFALKLFPRFYSFIFILFITGINDFFSKSLILVSRGNKHDLLFFLGLNF